LRGRARLLVAVVVGVAALLTACGAGPTVGASRVAPTEPRAPVAPLAGRPSAVVYGDSLAFETRDLLARDGTTAGMNVQVRAFGGLALCDALNSLRTDLATRRPSVVALEFIGNSFTPCMRDRAGRPLAAGTAAYEARWRADLTTAATLARRAGTRLVWATAPEPKSAAGAAAVRRLRTIAASVLAGVPGTRVTSVGDAVLAHGGFSATLPCLPDEGATRGCAHGRIAVRAPDGIHFCPRDPHAVQGVVGDCPVYSSGARRYASAFTAALQAALASR
jgi:hypothetical protein